ncbi:hypothetical protein CLOP_g12690 [Closterium sp. NIES-67]|nr:hypothetical protein CLOP_g12690 [Closterium sp. NIES-67]
MIQIGNGLPDPFWVSALRQVALVKNRVLATVGDKEWIPYVKWYGSAPTVNMLRAFGCMVVFHVPKEKRGKLEASGRWGVHLGIAKDHKGHEQLEAAKRLVRYVSATASVGLEYSGVRQRLQRGAADGKSGEMLLSCYTDASFNSVKADGTSIGGYVCLLGGGAVSWRSKKQNEVGLSSCETELARVANLDGLVGKGQMSKLGFL